MRSDPKQQATPAPPPGIAKGGLANAMFGGIGSAPVPFGSDPTDQVLQETLLGVNVRSGLGGSPLVGILPRWFKANPELVKAMGSPAAPGRFDPYMPMPDVSSWQVYQPRAHMKVTGSTNATAVENGMKNLDTKTGDNTATVAAVSQQPYLWTENQVADAIKKFQDAGMTNVTDFYSMQKEWSGLVQRAGAMYSLSSGQRKVTPWDVLDLYKNEQMKAGTYGGSGSGGSGSSPSTVTQRSRSVSTITNGDGWSALQNTLSRMLGRDPTDSEVRDFVGRMNHLAAKNPTITTSTTSGIGTASQSTSSHTKSGFDSNDVLQNAYQDAQSNPDYAEHQAATTYFNSALSALGAIGG